jgi:hypothetical protein
MLRNLLLVLLLSLVTLQADAQRKMRGVLKKKVAEATIYGNFGLYDGPYWGIGTSAQYLWGVGRGNQNFKIGLGIRNYIFNATNRDYATSDADKVATLRGGTDSVFFPKMNAVILNSYLALRFKVKRGIDFGMNIDLFGITFGGTKVGYFHSYELTLAGKERVNVQPYGFNLNPFLPSSNAGYGSSFNEAYFQFQANNILKFRAGLNYFVNEIETKTYITGNGKRFKNNNYMFMLGVTFNVRAKRTEREPWNFYNY